MKTFPECIDCVLKQAKACSTKFNATKKQKNNIILQTKNACKNHSLHNTPPELGGQLYKILAKELDNFDPYLNEKRKFNQLALDLLPVLKKLIKETPSPLETALRFCAAANFIDFGAPAGKTDYNLYALFENALKSRMNLKSEDNLTGLVNKLIKAKSVMYICDNAGEIVIDRLVMENIPNADITAVVRSAPAINDAIMEDALAAQINNYAHIIESGSSIPGTPLHLTNDIFKEKFFNSNIIISKGQGNFETLSEQKAPIYFLLTAKCQVVAKVLDCELGTQIVHTNKD